VIQCKSRRPRVEPTSLNRLRNLAYSYIPCFCRMVTRTLRFPADIVHVNGSMLAVIGVVHKLRYRSRFVLDINERPGLRMGKGSLISLFKPWERLILRGASRFADVATVVTQSDIETARELGFTRVVLVRNAPLTSWVAPYSDPPIPPDGATKAAVVGQIHEALGLEALLDALAHQHKTGSRRTVVSVYGPGRPAYVARLRSEAIRLKVDDCIVWKGVIDSAHVSKAYLDADVGLVLHDKTVPNNDGLSNRILECIASGRPVVASDLPENREFISRYNVGWLTEVAPEPLAATLASIGIGHELDELARHCRRQGESWLNWDAEFAKLLNTIDSELPSAQLR
jgi:glycosyltransferase involved in cell wall biosynthesis